VAQEDTFRTPARSSAQSQRLVLLFAGLTFATIFLARVAFDAVSPTVTFLYVLPIAAVATEYGRRVGILAGFGAVGLVGVLDLIVATDITVQAYLSRTVVFVMVGWLVGQMADRLRRAAKDAQSAARHFALAHDMLATVSIDGHFVTLNRSWERVLGWTPAELRARPFLEFVHPDDRERTAREAARLSAGAAAVSFVNRCRTKDDDWRWIEWSARAEPDDGLIYAAARDITTRRQAEQARQQAEERFRRAFEDSAVGMAVVDVMRSKDNRLAEANEAFCRMLGYAREELVEVKTLAELTHPDDLARLLRDARGIVEGSDSVFRAESRVVRADGSLLWVDATTSLVRDDTGAPAFRISQLLDIDARKNAEAALRDAAERALEASRLKSDFVANMSHEIRTPLNGVVGMADLMLDTEMTDEQRSYVDALHVSADALMSVIDDILDFSKIEAGKLELEPGDFAVRELLGAACAVVARDAHAKGIELIAWCDPDVPHALRADGARIRQVLTNLLGNAVKFTSEGEVVARVSRDPDDEARLRFDVSDTGIGIAPAALGSLFDAFAQADSSTTRQYGGSGLGLTISKQLVELMGGRVGVESTPGEGSTFWFTVPVAQADGPVALGTVFEILTEISRPVDLTGSKALVVDDNATNRTILASQLTSWGVDCDSAADASQALALIQAAAGEGRPYSLGLIDLHMPPGMNGIELAAAIRREPALRAMRLVILSSAGAGRAVAEGVEIDGFLTKPVVHNALRTEIVRVMGGAIARDHAPLQASRTRGDEAPRREGDGPHVLVAEDNPVNQRVVVGRLESMGCRVDVAGDGRAAVEMSGATPYAAIFMDIQMPVMDGFAATDAIRRREGDERHTPIVAVTAHSLAGDREKCLAAGMDDYLTKPLRAAALERVLARWLFPWTVVQHSDASVPNGATAPVLDPATLEAACGGDRDVRAEFVALFLEHSRGELDELRAVVAARDLERVRTVAHSLGGSAATLGAARLAAACSRLSHTAAAEQADGVEELFASVDRAYELTRAQLSDLVAGAR
jgi:two-component system sensor histidine kinase/response regulator